MNDAPQLLAAGEKAPAFAYQDHEGTDCHTRNLADRVWVVYFYPKDDTPGCTKEACGFRDQYTDFQQLNATVIGVSPDSYASHQKFRDKYRLPFGLASDPDSEIARCYGAWGPKKFMGRSYNGVHRVTFIVGKNGHIAKVFPKVKPMEHAEEVVQFIENLSK
jgi:peroxiredoxin Q/BCP